MLKVCSIFSVSALAVALVLGCESLSSQSDIVTGNVEFALVMDDGSEIHVVVWQITHPNGFSREGEIAVADPAATISGTIAGLPEDNGYTLVITATSTVAAECEGNAVFDIVAGATRTVSMTLQCHLPNTNGDLQISADSNMCPTIDYLSVSPLVRGIGKPIALFAEASDRDSDDTLHYEWTVEPNLGSFDSDTEPVNRFTCDTGGKLKITLTVADGNPSLPGTCTKTKRVDVECLFSGVFDELGWGSIMLGRPTDSSVTINVVGDISTLNPEVVYEVYFEYGTDPGALTRQTETYTPSGNDPIVLTIDGLLPNTEYFYRMRYRPYPNDGAQFLATKIDAFYTQRSEGAPFVFTVQADSHLDHDQVGCDESLYWVTVQQILDDEPDLHFDLGDTFNNKMGTPFLPGVMEGDIETIYPNYLNQRRYVGAVGRSAPVFLVLGNHENEEGWNIDDTPLLGDSVPFMNQNARKRYFVNPVPDDFYSGLPELWEDIIDDHHRDAIYAFHWGDALFVVIDPFWYTMVVPFEPRYGEDDDETVIGDRWSWTLGSEQYLWLKEILENSSAKYKFVFSHHLTGGGGGGGSSVAGYGRGGAEVAHLFEWGGHNADGTWGFTDHRPAVDGWDDPIHQLLAANDVTILFHGHDHLFAKEDLDGIVYQECPRPCALTDVFEQGTEVYGTAITSGDAQPNSGHLRVSVSPEAVVVDYVRSPTGEVTYSYTVTP